MKRRPKTYNQNNQKPQNKGASIAVYNDDVNGALRKLKKVLENNNRQKDLSRLEYYEKPTTKRKRVKEQAQRRHKRERRKGILTGSMVSTPPSGLKYMKCKRKRRLRMEERQLLMKSRRR